MKRLLLWAGGYSTDVTSDVPPEDSEQLVKLGGAVLFAAAWTAINWAIASTLLLPAGSLELRAGFAAAAAAAGAGLVLTIDRTMLYLLDARLSDRTAWSWVVFRIVLILAIGSFTTERLLPLALGADLGQQALVEREASEFGRQQRLDAVFQPGQLQARLAGAEDEVSRLGRELQVVPPDVRATLGEARNCRRDAQANRDRLVRAGHSRADARRAVAGRFARCAAVERRGRAALAAYRADVGGRLEVARQGASDYRSAYSKARTAVDARLEEGRKVEAGTLTSESSLVFWKLVAGNPFAAVKAAIFLLIMLSIELLPFIMKGVAGRTSLGLGLATARALTGLELKTRLDCQNDESDIALALSRAVAAAMVGAAQSADMQAFMSDLAFRQAAAVAPMDAAIRMMRAADQRKREFDTLAARAPDLAPIFHGLWTDALRESARNLAATTAPKVEPVGAAA